AVLMFCCARYRNVITDALSSPTMTTLGDASYSIYLLHAFTLRIFIPTSPQFSYSATGVLVWTLLMAVAIAFTLITAVGSYRTLEVPARSYLRRTLPLLLRPASRLSFVWLSPRLARGATVFVLVGGFIAWNWPQKFGPITIVEASYGGNCESSPSGPIN